MPQFMNHSPIVQCAVQFPNHSSFVQYAVQFLNYTDSRAPAGLCYGKLEAGILTFVIPGLLLGHLVNQNNTTSNSCMPSALVFAP
jgi:hypothetical protein